MSLITNNGTWCILSVTVDGICAFDTKIDIIIALTFKTNLNGVLACQKKGKCGMYYDHAWLIVYCSQIDIDVPWCDVLPVI